mgnify:CR=1 FL=1
MIFHAQIRIKAKRFSAHKQQPLKHHLNHVYSKYNAYQPNNLSFKIDLADAQTALEIYGREAKTA